MAARTASVSGLWSNTATWGGAAVPVDGDTITINSSVIVEFDVDQSGFATGLGAQTINGTLKVTNTAGTYYWKCAGTVTWGSAASYLANNGSTGGLLPSNVKFTQGFNGNFNNNFNTATIIDVNCQEPTHKYCKLSSGASATATVLSVDTDLTAAGDSTWWANPYKVRVDDINQAAESEEYTISSVSSTQITLTAGLSNAKSTGAYVILVSRNIEIIQVGSTNGTAMNTPGSATNAVSIAAAIRGFTTGFSSAANATIGGAIAGCTTGISISNGCTVNASLSGNTTGITAGQGNTLNNLISGSNTGASGVSAFLFSSTFIGTGCASIVSGSNGVRFHGMAANSTTGLNVSSGFIISGAVFTNNTRDINASNSGVAYNTSFASATEFLNYNAISRTIWDYIESIDHDQVAGSFRAWTRGGITSSVASPTFDASRVRSYNAVCETASYPVFKQESIRIPSGASLYVRCYVRKDASMSYLPRLWIFSADKEPLLSGSPDAEVIMTNSTDTWEILEATVTNTTDAPKVYIVRKLAKNASGNVYFDPIIRVSSYIQRGDMVGGLIA